MSELNLETLETLLNKGRQLKSLLTEEPDLLKFLELLKGIDGNQLVIPTKADRLVGPKEVLNILRISPSRLEEYVKSGRLTAYYTPPSSGRKFWLSEVMTIPQALQRR